MKTNRTITTIITLSFLLFLSVASSANFSSNLTGKRVKTTDKEQTTSGKNSNCEESSSVSAINEFSYLRFDVNNFTTEPEIVEFPVKSMDYLRFDVSNYIGKAENEIKELPAASEFEYLRFDITRFTQDNSTDLTEMPENQLEYLRFDVNSFSGSNTGEVVELPACDENSSI